MGEGCRAGEWEGLERESGGRSLSQIECLRDWREWVSREGVLGSLPYPSPDRVSQGWRGGAGAGEWVIREGVRVSLQQTESRRNGFFGVFFFRAGEWEGLERDSGGRSPPLSQIESCRGGGGGRGSKRGLGRESGWCYSPLFPSIEFGGRKGVGEWEGVREGVRRSLTLTRFPPIESCPLLQSWNPCG